MNSEVVGSRRFQWLLLPVLAACSLPLNAQEVAPVRANTWELNGALGYTYGIDEGPGTRSRVNTGATLSYALTKNILPYVEYSYFPGVRRVRQEMSLGTPSVPYTASYDIPFVDFHGGVHVRFTPPESRLVPYAAFGMGLLHARESEYVYQEQGRSAETLTRRSDTGFAVNFGGGLRYYVGQYWGVRGEIKAYKPTGTFDEVFGKVQFGVFWQFGGR